MRRLEDKVIVVVGGTTGIGLSAVRALLREGARVIAIGRDTGSSAALAEELGERGHAWAADAAEPGTAMLAIQTALERFHRFDGLFHVAGGSGRKMGDGPLHEVSDAGWEYTMRQNLSSVFYSNRAALRVWVETGAGGSILNLSSVLAFAPAPEHFATHAYAAAKASVIGLTRSAAAYYAKWNIRMNVLAPGLVESPMSERAAGDPVVRAYAERKQPLDGGRIGQPIDLDGAAIYFLSDESKFVTGQVLAVDGGWALAEGQIQAGHPASASAKMK